MSDETKNVDDSQLIEFVRSEIVRQRKRTRVTWTGGLILIVIVFAYMAYITTFVRSALQPQNAAGWIAYALGNSLPGMLVETERNLTAKAPEVAEQFFTRVKLYPRELRRVAQAQVDLVADEVLPQLEHELTTTLQAYVDENKAAAAALFSEHQSPELAQAFIDQITIDVVSDLDGEMKRDGQEGMTHLYNMSLAAMQDFNYQLSYLNDVPGTELTRSEQLHRQLIIKYLQAIDQLTLGARVSHGEIFRVGETGLGLAM